MFSAIIALRWLSVVVVYLSVPRSVSDTIVAIVAIVKQLILMSSELNAA